MKTIKFIIVAVIAMAMNSAVIAQMSENKTVATKTESFFVNGLCEMCKNRIEKAAALDGVSKAEWYTGTKILTVVYNPSSTDGDEILKSVSSAGHDNEKFRAPDDVYNKLPACCKYDRNMTKTSEIR